MNKKCHRKKSSLSSALGLHRNNIYKERNRKRCSLSVALGLHRNYLYREEDKKRNSCFVTLLVHRHFLYHVFFCQMSNVKHEKKKKLDGVGPIDNKPSTD